MKAERKDGRVDIDTVRKIKDALADLPDDMPIAVAVGTKTGVYPVAYVPVWEVGRWHGGDKASLRVTLPDGFYIGQRKRA